MQVHSLIFPGGSVVYSLNSSVRIYYLENMGCRFSSFGSTEEKTQDARLQQELIADRAREDQTKRILCLGTPNSGRSTVLKQLKQIYGNGFNDRDRKRFQMYIFTHIIEQMQLILDEIDDLGDEKSDELGYLKV